MKKFGTLSVLLVLALMIFAGNLKVSAHPPNGLPEIEIPENARINISLEARDNLCYLTFTLDAVSEAKENLPKLGVDLNVTVYSPSWRYVKTAIDGSAELDVTDPTVQAIVSLIEGMTPENLTAFAAALEGQSLRQGLATILPYITEGMGLPAVEIPAIPEMEEITIYKFTCTKFDWVEPKLEAGLEITLRGIPFENEELLAEMPEDKPIEVSLSISSVQDNMSISASLDSKSAVFQFDMSVVIVNNTQTTDLDLNGHFKLELTENVNFLEFLPYEMVTQMITQILTPEDIHEFDRQLRRSDINLEIKVPLETSVWGIAPAPVIEADEQVALRWSGENAADATVSLLTGKMYVPPEEKVPPAEEKAKFPWLWIGIVLAAIVALVVAVSRFRSREIKPA